MNSLAKYLEVMKITLKSKWVYVYDTVLAQFFLVIILFVYINLWKMTYGQQTVIDGFTLPQMIWYLVIAETIILSMVPFHRVLEKEIREGDIAIRLNKPYSYLAFHYSAYLGETMLKSVVVFSVGALFTWFTVGTIPFHVLNIPVLFLVFFLANLFNFIYASIIGLISFWTEDITGIFFILERAKWLLGGFLLPLEVFPEPARSIAESLPFKNFIYGPAKLFTQYDSQFAYHLLGQQLIYLAFFGAVAFTLYSIGIKRLELNGG